jgi:hypothetical protein
MSHSQEFAVSKPKPTFTLRLCIFTDAQPPYLVQTASQVMAAEELAAQLGHGFEEDEPEDGIRYFAYTAPLSAAEAVFSALLPDGLVFIGASANAAEVEAFCKIADRYGVEWTR